MAACKSPILFLTFNRLDTTKEVFNQIAKVKPPKIYLASDGARDKIDTFGIKEKDKVDEVREFLISHISWDCEIKTRFLSKNLGCKKAVSSAIEWFFDNEEYGIILEDDCFPSISFFRFCDEMLEMYKNNEKIFMVSGWSAFDFDKKTKDSINSSYYFSKYNHIWGWASWRRAWKKYELENKNFIDDFKKIKFDSRKEKNEYKKVLSAYFRGEIDTWDYPWSFSIWKNNGLCIYPKNNMIKNIGFNRDDATHTTGESKYQNMPIYEICFPLNHPDKIQRNQNLDMANYKIIASPNIFKRIINKIKRYIIKRKTKD
ncbi:methyltransferase FkbM [Helicobacter sp. MIT 99-5507]|uniref:methyltransferase FkbM n=1 Tax=Helicobacter sp. MIT 99-5507 TaxID=152489 RepID=UPI000E1F625F|nr:methyltransferase FkbM [Helicobacter sp. MIT 99-5507]RDU58619.1 methyltransferase FkbM [Helicobacter sp. MIT 99-5507]